MKKIIFSILAIPVLGILIIIVNYVIWENVASRISEGKPIVQKDTVKTALLVIDVQEGITGRLAEYDYYISKSGELISNINLITDSSVSNNIPVIYVKNEITNFLINIINSSLAKGSTGAELDSRLKIVSDIIINKDKGDAFTNPLLDSILIKKDINKLVFVGLDLANCVRSTVLGAVNRNYKICLISEGLLAKSDSLKNITLDEFKKSGFEILSSGEYFKSLHK
jgi:nicotinamidase/pyrazinamidase